VTPTPGPPLEPGFHELLEYLRSSRGFDFTGYKPSTLISRIQKRMHMVRIHGFAEYQDHLEVHPEEFGQLFNFMLINVTSFFRDPQIWKYVAEEVVPAIAERAEHRLVRIWSAGCASGEEAYTMAMLLAERLGREAFLENVKIYATDVDEEALAEARAAVYARPKMEGVPEDLGARYFEQVGGGQRFVFDKDLRRSVIFGRHNLVADAPISRIDLLVCRNTLMYLNAETQAQVLNNLHFALNDDGYLLLGKAEMLFTKQKSFVAVDLKRRVFRKVPGEEAHARLWLTPPDQAGATLGKMADSLIFGATPLAQLILNPDGILFGANPQARALFRIQPGDIGRSIHELEPAFRPVDMVLPLQQVIAHRASVQISDVFFAGGPPHITHISVDLAPLVDDRANVVGILISYTDVSRMKKVEEDLQIASQELETALEDLQSTNEELVTTNQELQATNEELETTNQELQSTNEELEMMNEELESTNDELQAVNEEARRRAADLDEAHLFLQSVLSGLGSAVIVIDADRHITMWSRDAEEMWGLRSPEARGQALEGLDIGLPVEELMPSIRRVLARKSPREQVALRATNRRGKGILCAVSVGPLGSDGRVLGAILLMEEQLATE
jgi:two-component system, chemotaxis family, CheB/CheR fusion protein